MAATVQVNNRTVVHRTSDGVSYAFPDVCKTPPVPLPIPYTNVAFSKDAANTAATVFADGQEIMIRKSWFATSIGDEPGTLGGVISGTYKGKASFTNYSFDVKAEGQNVPRLYDPMGQNHGSPDNAQSPAEEQPNVEAQIAIICQAICACQDATLAGYKTRTLCVDMILAQMRIANGARVYWDPRFPGLYVEVPFLKYGSDVWEPVLSTSQTGTWNNLPLPGFAWPPMAGSKRPDVVLAKDPSKKLTKDNIARVIDIKYPDDRWGEGQREAYNEMDPTGEALELSPSYCGCGPDPVRVPVTEAEREAVRQEARERAEQVASGSGFDWGGLVTTLGYIGIATVVVVGAVTGVDEVVGAAAGLGAAAKGLVEGLGAAADFVLAGG